MKRKQREADQQKRDVRGDLHSQRKPARNQMSVGVARAAARPGKRACSWSIRPPSRRTTAESLWLIRVERAGAGERSRRRGRVQQPLTADTHRNQSLTEVVRYVGEMAYLPIEDYGIIGNLADCSSGRHERFDRLVLLPSFRFAERLRARFWMSGRAATSELVPRPGRHRLQADLLAGDECPRHPVSLRGRRRRDYRLHARRRASRGPRLSRADTAGEGGARPDDISAWNAFRHSTMPRPAHGRSRAWRGTLSVAEARTWRWRPIIRFRRSPMVCGASSRWNSSRARVSNCTRLDQSRIRSDRANGAGS